MSSYLIKIDRKSITKNENAGETRENNYISSTGEFSVDGAENLEFMDDRIKCISRSSQYGRNAITRKMEFTEKYSYVVGGMSCDELQMLADHLRQVFPGKVSFTFQNHFETMDYIHPIPPFSFNYKPTTIKCQWCKKKFKHTELIDTEEFNERTGEYDYVTNCCPKCERNHCCSVTYESFEAVMLERAGLSKTSFFVG